MKKEHAYFLSIVAISTLSAFYVLLLLKKYSTLTLEHFFEVCNQVISGIFGSGVHYIGFLLTILITISLVILFAQAVFSYLKTKQQLEILLQKKSSKLYRKLSTILKRNSIPEHALLVVGVSEDIAITINWLNPQIVLSTGLINKLPGQALESVVLHEYYHFKNKHPFLLVASEILTASIFFIPLLKDINKKFRSVLESQADYFVRTIQKDSVPLELALSKVKNTHHFPLFPSFASRKEYHFGKKNGIVSIIVVIIGLALLSIPTQSHAAPFPREPETGNCNSTQCSLDCVSHRLPAMSLVSD